MNSVVYANPLMRVGVLMLQRGMGRVTVNEDIIWVKGAMQNHFWQVSV